MVNNNFERTNHLFVTKRKKNLYHITHPQQSIPCLVVLVFFIVIKHGRSKLVVRFASGEPNIFTVGGNEWVKGLTVTKTVKRNGLAIRLNETAKSA